MKKVQIFIEHDIIIRHFIKSETFRLIENNYEVQYVFPKNSKRVKQNIYELNLTNFVEVEVPANRISKLREYIKACGIKRAKQNPKFSFLIDIWKGILPRKSFLRIQVISLPIINQLYKWLVIDKLPRFEKLQSIIEKFSPQIIIHPCVLEGLFINDLIEESKKMNIPMITLMNSWDNPSTKASVLGIPETLVVWGEQTKQHAIEFMQVPNKNIHIFGPAQFEVYREEPTFTREQYCKDLNIDPSKKLILYAGSSKAINEIDHLKHLESAIGSGEVENSHVIFKPHPWRDKPEDEPYFYDLTWNHVSIDPKMDAYYRSTFSNQNSGAIYLSSYQDTHNLLSATDILISNVSTILLEAALHGQPVLCMVSDQELADNPFLNVTFKSLYFKEILERIYILRCNDHNELTKKCTKLIEMSSEPGFKRKQIDKTKYFVDMGTTPYPEKLYQLVQEKIG